MKVFKFGGASVKNAESIRNLVTILNLYAGDSIWIVVSAMGKMTNQLELLLEDYLQKRDFQDNYQNFKDYHIEILEDLFPFRSASVYSDFFTLLDLLKEKLSSSVSNDYYKEYSEIVSYGELVSTTIVSHYLDHEGIVNEWIDARKIIKSTSSNYCKVNVDWETSKKNVINLQNTFVSERDSCIFVTQGFVASNHTGETTTLGREGSDFTGAILAWCCDAESLIIWKDVPGMMNADPKKFQNTKLLAKISYKEALELSFYGASVIHPKTIKPLQNKGIPLYVRSFMAPETEGTIIQKEDKYDENIPSYISKSNQVLISISPRDFSMVVEKNISEIYGVFAELGISINLMQNSALNFSLCFDENENQLKALLSALSDKYKLLYNNNLELLTVRHYQDEMLQNLLRDRTVILEQKSRATARFLLRNRVN